MTRSGEYRHQVRIERKRSSGRNAAGEVIGQWVELATRRAKYEIEGAGEVFTSEQRQARNHATFTLRFLSGVLSEMRLILISETPHRLFDILNAVDKDGRREELIITALERVEVTPDQDP